MTSLTVFIWGYDGWGASTRQLKAAVDTVEASRGYEPPYFVDLRISRSVRVEGFKEAAFVKVVSRRDVTNGSLPWGMTAQRHVRDRASRFMNQRLPKSFWALPYVGWPGGSGLSCSVSARCRASRGAMIDATA